MCVGAVLAALFAGEGRVDAPGSFVRAAKAAPLARPDPAAGAARAEGRTTARGRAFKLHLANGNDDVRQNVWVYLPSAFDPSAKKLRLVVMFHGFKNCIDSYVSDGGRICTPGGEQRTGYDVPAQVERSGTGAIVVVPQLAFDTTSSDPGKIGKIGGLKRFVKELVEEALVPAIGAHAYDDVERIMLIASSGGYQGLLPALANGRVEKIRDVYLLDAFYVDTSALTAFLRERPEAFRPDAPDPRHFGLVFCRKSGTAHQSRDFGYRLGVHMNAHGDGPFYAFDGWSQKPTLDDLRVPAFVYMSRLPHDEVVSEYLWKFIAVSGI